MSWQVKPSGPTQNNAPPNPALHRHLGRWLHQRECEYVRHQAR